MTFVAFLVSFLASLGVPASACHGTIVLGADTCDVRPLGPAPDDGPTWVAKDSNVQHISNGL